MSEDILNLPVVGVNGNHRVYSNFFSDNNIIQNTILTKNLIIDTLRQHFADNIYTYRADEFGFL
jgi:hypothetical protein